MALKYLFLVPVLTGLALPATAQTALTLSANGAAQAEPDEAVANFNVQAVKPDAASAQAVVNQAVANAMAAAKAVPGVVVTTGGYNSYTSTPDGQTAPQFTAQQSLTLTQPAKNGVPDKPFTALLAKLQANGLLLNGLSGDLSEAGQNQAQREAIRDALAQLRAQADDIADALHEKVGALKTLNVNTGGGPVPPMPRMMMMAAAPAPQSAPDNVTVTANVSAEIELSPGS
ncbi:MAG: SIMPL domain-containing protein [Rhodospirillales bacterium]|nr:SIMPL domain-containing protein [Rhodospirillales bacterium]MDE2320102.1 SIMPL domain-containing protein [Rhodospirillales bacterium]